MRYHTRICYTTKDSIENDDFNCDLSGDKGDNAAEDFRAIVCKRTIDELFGAEVSQGPLYIF